ncbi:hypothetical protein Pan189_09420 [Stratiformator vulcanicus]|uniref:Uncharacterized protein n=1 Tax=Stratiformator vulcanicus TaxID=2527980 RepID=A0A517QY61_9PLAN|nr:hypothetical protein Pan189_09420 [Stratiformator vulcanicus]
MTMPHQSLVGSSNMALATGNRRRLIKYGSIGFANRFKSEKSNAFPKLCSGVIDGYSFEKGQGKSRSLKGPEAPIRS